MGPIERAFGPPQWIYPAAIYLAGVSTGLLVAFFLFGR